MYKISIFTIIILLLQSCSSDSNQNDSQPLPPSNLAGTITSSNQINLSWSDNSNNETGFKIERKTVNGSYAIVGTTLANVATFVDSGLNQGTTYIYRVYSYNSGGNSPSSSNELNITILHNIAIGNQIWTTTNLDVSTYRDGTPIPQVTDPTSWRNIATGAWCYYNNDPSNNATYGKLYNWYAVAGIYDAASLNDPSLRKQLAPHGWHVPTDAEWSSLINYLDPNANGGTTSLTTPNVAGGKMKATGTSLWNSPNTAATNESGFSGFPAGMRTSGSFSSIRSWGAWWSSSENSTSGDAWSRFLTYDSSNAYKNPINKNSGYSVRCLRD